MMILNGKSYATAQNAMRKLADVVGVSERTLVAVNAQGRFVPVYVWNEHTDRNVHFTIRNLADNGITVVN